jgi:hypothetical protein
VNILPWYIEPDEQYRRRLAQSLTSLRLRHHLSQRPTMSTHETPTIHLSPAYAVISATDHTGWVIICTTVGLPLLLVFAAIRYVVRRGVDFGLDDGFVAASTVRSYGNPLIGTR